MKKASIFSFQFKTIALVSSTALVATASLQALGNNFKNISVSENIKDFIDVGTKMINGVSGLSVGSSSIYGSVYNAGATSYSVAGNTISSAKNAFGASYSGINNGISWSTKNFEVATNFLKTAYNAVAQSAPSVYSAILSGAKTAFKWLQDNWQNTIITKIKEYSDLSQWKKHLGLENENWESVKKGFSDFFENFKKSPSKSIYDSAYNIYRVVFKFVGPWGWSFLSAGIFKGLSYVKLWNHITSGEKFKETLIEIMKFFKKFQNTLEIMKPETRDIFVKWFLEDPEKFLKKIQLLNKGNSQSTVSTILNLKESELEQLLKLDEAQLKEALAARTITATVIEGTGAAIGGAVNTLVGSAEDIIDVFTGNGSSSKPTSSIGEPIKDIITSSASTVGDFFGSVVSSAFSLFGGSSKKEEKPS